jgi:hypothetical protein
MLQQLYVLTCRRRHGRHLRLYVNMLLHALFAQKQTTPRTSPPAEANKAFFTVITRCDHWPLYSDYFGPTYSIVLIFILILSFNLNLIALQVKSCIQGFQIKFFLPFSFLSQFSSVVPCILMLSIILLVQLTHN